MTEKPHTPRTPRTPTPIEPDGTPQDTPQDTLIIPSASDPSSTDYHAIPDEILDNPETPVYRTANFATSSETPSQLAEGTNLNITLTHLPYYIDFVNLYNFPVESPAHALLTYAMQLGYSIESPELTNAEIKQTSNINPRGMLQGICAIYNVEPEAAIRYWPEVDAILAQLKLPTIPHEPRYRHVKLDQSKLTAVVTAAMNELGKKQPPS